MLSARELALEQNPNATGWVNQRIIYTHGIGAAMVPVNEVGSEGQPRLLISNLPPASTNGAPPIDPAHSGIYFGERPSSYVVVGAQQDEFDYPTGESDTDGSIGTETRWTGTTGIPLDKTLMRLLFAARFRDLDLLISDQVTRQQPAALPSLAERPAVDGRAVPALRQGPVPGHRRHRPDGLHPGRLHDLRPVPERAGLSTRPPTSGLGGDAFNYIRNSVKITIDAYDGTMHFYVNDPDDPIIRAYEGVFPALFEPLSAMPADLQEHLRVPEDLFNVQTSMFGRYHVTNTQQFFGADDLWTVPSQTSEQTLPSEAYYVEMRLPNEEGVEFLLLQPMVPTGRPNMIAWVAARMDGAELRPGPGLSLPGRHDDLRAGPDRGADRPGPGHQRPGLALEPVGQQGHPRQPDRRAARRFADLPAAGLPPVDRVGLPGVQADRRRLAAPGRLGRYARRRACACCWRPRPATPPSPPPGQSPGPSPTPTPPGDARARRQPDDGPDAARERRAARPTCRA